MTFEQWEQRLELQDSNSLEDLDWFIEMLGDWNTEREQYLAMVQQAVKTFETTTLLNATHNAIIDVMKRDIAYAVDLLENGSDEYNDKASAIARLKEYLK